MASQEHVFTEGADRCWYRSAPSDRPKWMRGASDRVRRTRSGEQYVRRVGWRLEPGNRMFTTCIKHETITTEWRH